MLRARQPTRANTSPRALTSYPRALVAGNPTVGAIIREQLSAAGYDVHWARNRVEAGALWQPGYYDVVLLDLRRDTSEGEDFAHGIKATDPGQRIIFLDGRKGTKEVA